MSVSSRVNKIEKAVKINKKYQQRKIIFLHEFEGRYFIEKEGQYTEIEKPTNNDPNTMIWTIKAYSDPTKPYIPYEMYKNTGE